MIIREAVLADQRFDMVSQMKLSGDRHGAELYQLLRKSMQKWQEAISSELPGEVVPRERWEPVFDEVKEIAEEINASGRLPPVLK